MLPPLYGLNKVLLSCGWGSGSINPLFVTWSVKRMTTGHWQSLVLAPWKESRCENPWCYMNRLNSSTRRQRVSDYKEETLVHDNMSYKAGIALINLKAPNNMAMPETMIKYNKCGRQFEYEPFETRYIDLMKINNEKYTKQLNSANSKLNLIGIWGKCVSFESGFHMSILHLKECLHMWLQRKPLKIKEAWYFPTVMLERMCISISQPEFKSLLCHQRGLCLWAGHLYFLSLSFLDF